MKFMRESGGDMREGGCTFYAKRKVEEEEGWAGKMTPFCTKGQDGTLQALYCTSRAAIGKRSRLDPIPPKEKSLLRRGLGGKQKTGEVVGIYAYSPHPMLGASEATG